ncbi:TPA: hypothetical protein CPT92_01260 [Candidatus Gastranaerophilales bacterium HUM_13]|jgi:glycosyltransferase, group 2 family|nr:MAG TPA: hypothetical protein CPT92_01260 [Candidatus Gastranaerophilales bacterium HUM_13]
MCHLITIIIPVKNGTNYIKQALDGIIKQNVNLEIIVVDDGSTDNTGEIAKEYGCIVLRNEISQGPVKAKNKALEFAKGDYIMFHDHDDIMVPDILHELYREMEESPDVSAVMAKVRDFYSPDLSEEEKTRTLIKKEPYYGLFTGAVLIRKSVFEKIGLFNDSVTAGEIIDWQSKMCANHLKIKKLDFVATNRRIHSSNFGKTQQKTEFKDYAALLRAKLRK